MNNNRLFAPRAVVTLVFTLLFSVAVKAQKPEVTSVDKLSGSLEEIITIKGSGFGTDPTKLIVFFGADKTATPISATDQLIEVKVPAGATYEHIAVTNTTNKLTGYSHDQFLISFGGTFPFVTTNLGAEQQFQSESELYDHCLCDLNGDGLVDIATANRSSNNIAIFRNTSTVAGAINFAARATVGVGAPTLQIKCGDLNGDGRPDLVASEGTIGANDTRVFILQNNGAMSFAPPLIFTFTKHKTSKLEIADLDRDGRPEVLVGDQFVSDPSDPNKPAKIGVLINSSNGAISFSGSMIVTIPKGTLPEPAFQSTDAIIAQDLNGDNFPELVTSQYAASASNIAIVPNTSVPGAISFGTAIKLSKYSDAIRDIRVGDLDGDGKPDIAFTGVSSGRVGIFQNTGSGNTIGFATNPVLFTGTLGMWGIDLGDIDGDGKTDIFASNVQSKYFMILNNNSSPGNFSFGNMTVTTEFVNRHIRLGDLNGDGKPDVSICSVDRSGAPASKISVFQNNSCPTPKISPTTSPVRLCSGVLPYKLTATVVKNAYYQWFKNGTPLACGQNQNTFDVTAATGTGIYTVKIFSGGATGCATPALCVTESAPIDVTVVAGGSVTVGPTSNGPVCIGSTLILNVTNNLGDTYKWTGPDGFSATGISPTLTNFQPKNAGTYQVEVTVAAGNCVASIETVEVQAKDVTAFQITPAGSVVVCEGEPAKVLSVVSQAGYTYQWQKNNVDIPSATANTYSVPSVTTSNGDYTLVATSGSCLPTETAPVKVTVAPNPIASFTMSKATACAGELVTFAATNNAGDADYAWNFGDGKTSDVQNPEHIFSSAGGFSVVLTVSFNGACPATDTKPITITTAPTMQITTTAPDYVICPGETITLSIDNTFTNPVWSNGSQDHSITVGDGGKYKVTATAPAPSLCALTDESDEVIKLPAPGVIVTADPQQIDEGASSQLTAMGLDNYSWTPVETLSAANIENPVATPLVTTTYTVTGTDNSGCTGTATIQITVKGEIVVNKLEPKNFFSPNNSGHNDFWTVDKILDFPQCEVTIYDDKGVKVFSAKPYQNDWNGTYNGKELPDGVYFYVIRCDGEENSPRTGSITLIR